MLLKPSAFRAFRAISATAGVGRLNWTVEDLLTSGIADSRCTLCLEQQVLAFMALASNQTTRGLLAKRLPAPGEGPSREAQARGCFYGRVVGKGVPDASGVSPTAQVEIVFHGDPGYSETAKMLAEAALCLCQDDLPPASGVLTPAVCMGKELVARLRARDQRWLVSETVVPAKSSTVSSLLRAFLTMPS